MTSPGCSSFDLHHHLQQPPQFLSSREPFAVLTGGHWCGAAFTALNSTVCCSLATYCTHQRYRFQHTADCISKCTQAPASFSLQHKPHTITGVFARVDIAHLCASVLLRVFISPPKGGKSSRRSVATALRLLLQRRERWSWALERSVCGVRACVCVCLKLHAAALSLQTSRLCHSCSGGRRMYSCRRRWAHTGERGRGGGSTMEDSYLLPNFLFIFLISALSSGSSVQFQQQPNLARQHPHNPAAAWRHPLLPPLTCLIIIYVKWF